MMIHEDDFVDGGSEPEDISDEEVIQPKVRKVDFLKRLDNIFND